MATAPPLSASTLSSRKTQIEPTIARASSPTADTSEREDEQPVRPDPAGQPRRQRTEAGEADHRQRGEQPGDAAAGVQAVLEIVEHRADARDGRPHRDPVSASATTSSRRARRSGVPAAVTFSHPARPAGAGGSGGRSIGSTLNEHPRSSIATSVEVGEPGTAIRTWSEIGAWQVARAVS